MKVIIAGSRTIKDRERVFKAIEDSGFKITEVVSGCAAGVDTLGEEWAKINKIDIKRFKPEWGKHRSKTGKDISALVRNTDMAKYADALIAVHDGSSTGTAHMIREAKKMNLRIFHVIHTEKHESTKSDI